MRRLRVLLAVAALAGLGAFASIAASAVTATTGTVTACATVTAAAHTVAVDGSGVATVGGDTATNCATTTYTVPTVTQTVTATVTQPTTTTATTTTPAPSYLFDDEFNGAAGSEPSSSLWNAKTLTMSSGVHMDGWTNIQEDGQGHVVITATKDAAGVWHSGFLTGNAGGFSFGGQPYDIVARAQVACGAGTWSSPVWTWTAPYGAGGIENDVIEHLDGKEPDGYHATLHNWVSGNQQNGHLISTGLPLCQGFHDYEARVYADHVDYYFDGTLEATASAASVGLTNLLSYQEVANISLNMGGWAGTPTIPGPVSILVDYVRVTALP